MPAYLSPEERQLIDAALAEGRVTRLALGQSSRPDVIWCNKTNRLVYTEPVPFQARLTGAASPAIQRVNMFRAQAAEQRRETILSLYRDGKGPVEISKLIGLNRRRVTKHLALLREEGLIE